MMNPEPFIRNQEYPLLGALRSLQIPEHFPTFSESDSQAMTSPSPRMSVVLPVRDSEHKIEQRVVDVLNALVDMSRSATEIVVVDDGSKDSTPEVLDELKVRYPQVRVVRHSRPRGLEAAGQTGLERASGDLVFIQETDTMVRIEDLQRLLRMSEDESVVAARAESTPKPLTGALLRRLRAWGTNADQQIAVDPAETKSSIQMIRRPHLQQLAGPTGDRFKLQSETIHATTVETV